MENMLKGIGKVVSGAGAVMADATAKAGEKLVETSEKLAEKGAQLQRHRGFEVCKGYEDKGVMLPSRATVNSAGYDFYAVEDVVIPAGIDGVAITAECQLMNGGVKFPIVMVPTGVKAYFKSDEVLRIYNRSSNGVKKGLMLANSVGIVDSDYYSNADNDGHIMFAFFNVSGKDVVIKKGDRVGQGVFEKYLKVDDDDALATKERAGGFGSTGE